MTFNFSVPGHSERTEISVEAGSSVIFVGANGGGKTRLAVFIEDLFQLNAHRISAHRALSLNPNVAKVSEREALWGLRTGNASETAVHGHRVGHRWHGNLSVALLNDFDFLLQALFGDQTNKSLVTHNRNRAGDNVRADPTKFEQLVDIWGSLLSHRKLHISGDNIQVSAQGSEELYKGSEMSDGERAIFYLIGQTLVAADSSLLIFDEPELHVHRSIMGKLWDALESARPDCAFVFITHDLEFAASRVAKKYVIRDFNPAPYWTIESVPDDSGFSEEVTTMILGSRRPILFVEGGDSSLDLAIYRCCYPQWTVIPRGSCEQVIHSVVTLRRNHAFTRITCSGIVDADDYQVDDITYLNELGIKVLPVSEIENVILLPAVSRAIAISEGYEGDELENRLSALKLAVFNTLGTSAAIDSVVTRYCRRRIDRLLKKIDLSNAGSIAEITQEYASQTALLNVGDIAAQASGRISNALLNTDLPLLLANYDNKALMALAATHLKKTRLNDFEGWLTRVLRNSKTPTIVSAIRNILPDLSPM